MTEDLIQIRPSKDVGTVADASKPGVYIRTFGCQMNEYDSEKLLKIVEQRYRTVATPEEAELILINTCSVREKPEQKLFSLLGEMREFKEQNNKVLIGVGGCVAQQEGKNIIKRSSLVDFVFGTHNLSLVPALIDRRKLGFDPPVAIDYRDEWEDLPPGFTGDGRVAVFVSISRGCNKNCTYCIVPTTRGKEASRALEEIKREVRIAAHRGAREVTLLGQTVNSYGLDLNPRIKFSALLDEVSKIDGIERIRFTSPHPQEIKEDFIELVSQNKKICRHIHMPLQSGSNAILKAMNRNYRRERYIAIIEALKAADPDIAITTDIIVGFPGETEQDFEDTLDLMRTVQFDNSYSFMFSPRPGTVAATLPDHIAPDIQLARLKKLQLLQVEISAKRLAAWVGREAEVLIEGPSMLDPECLQGKTSQNVTFNLAAPVPGLKIGDIIRVKVTAACRSTLRGEYIDQVHFEPRGTQRSAGEVQGKSNYSP